MKCKSLLDINNSSLFNLGHFAYTAEINCTSNNSEVEKAFESKYKKGLLKQKLNSDTVGSLWVMMFYLQFGIRPTDHLSCFSAALPPGVSPVAACRKDTGACQCGEAHHPTG